LTIICISLHLIASSDGLIISTGGGGIEAGSQGFHGDVTHGGGSQGHFFIVSLIHFRR